MNLNVHGTLVKIFKHPSYTTRGSKIVMNVFD